MPSLAEIRQQYPQYGDMPDAQLADALHRKFYSDMPREEFDRRLGVVPSTALPEPRSELEKAGRGFGLGVRNVVEGAASLPYMVAEPFVQAANMMGAELPSPRDALSRTLSRAGLPEAETSGERIMSRAQKEIAALLPTMGAGVAARGAQGAAGGLSALAEAPISQVTGAGASGAAGGAVREAGGGPVMEFIASLLAGIGGAGVGAVGDVVAGTSPQAGKFVPERADRLAAFERSKIDPSLADVTQSQTAQRGTKVLEAVPVTGDIVKNKETARIGQAQARATEVANLYGSPGTPNSLGEATQKALERFRFSTETGQKTAAEIVRQPTRDTSIAAKANTLYSRVPIKPDAKITATQTLDALKAAQNRFSDPNLSKVFANSRLGEIAEALTTSNGNVTWDDLRNLRTEIRYLQSRPTLETQIDDRLLGSINEALSHDMLAGAKSLGGDRAAQLVQRADQFYAGSMERVRSSLQSVFNAKTPEAAFGQIEKALQQKGGDLNKVLALRRSLKPDEWGDIAATVIDRMGQPTAGQVAGDRPAFEIQNFVTNYSKLDPAAKRALFDGAGKKASREALDDLVKALSAMKGTEKLSNVSQSGNLVITAGTVGAAVTEPVTTGGLLALSALGSHGIYNPAIIRAATRELVDMRGALARQSVRTANSIANQ